MEIEGMQQVLNVYAPSYDPYDGYGRAALELMWHLSQMGVHVNALGADSLAWGDKLHPEMKKLLEKPIKPNVGGIAMGYPTLYEGWGEMLTAGQMVAVTMFESDKLPPGWSAALNKCRAVIVPAKYEVEVFQKSGVVKPIRVVPLGISETFKYVDRAERYYASGLAPHPLTPSPRGEGRGITGAYIPRRDGQPFTFLALGDRGNRKGWDVAAHAFYQAFGDNPNFKLIIKTREMGFPYQFSNPNVEVLQVDMDEHQQQALYAQVDAYVFPTRGEGFGLTPREAARTGLPVIATNWGGTADDLPAWGYPLNSHLVKAWDKHPRLDGVGKWAEPHVDHLAKLMAHVVSRQRIHTWYEAGRERQDQRVAGKVQKLYQWKQFAQRVIAIWNEMSDKPATTADRRKRRADRKADNGK
jgi:glycosyltransferase involved in cell wall biosynthesis